MRRLLFSLALLSAVGPASADAIVRAADYDSYWLWAGVRAHPEVRTARRLYLLQGEIGPAPNGGPTRLIAQGATQPGPHRAELWLAYRVRSLEFTPEIVAAIARRFALWRAQPGSVAGVQVDFDASTRRLDRYAAFLRDLRKALPEGCKLSVTGLMDWAAQAKLEDLDNLHDAVDEIVFQTYRGARTVADIDAYVKRLARLRIPFRLGLAEGATWSPPPGLAGNPNFRGYVVFLRNARVRR